MKRLSERKIDRLLNIKTRGTRNPKEKDHFRYEATPYKDLLLLFDKLKLTKDDHFVDFGSGKGRVCFLVDHLYNATTYGLEINRETYHDALLNLTDYKEHKKDVRINFINEYAEKYNILDKQNVFFFFNPFTVNIFEDVIKNIIDSLNKHKRKITIILTYPIVDYVEFILTNTNFIVVDYIEAQNKKEKRNKFIILSN